jgi:hypothetical protein
MGKRYHLFQECNINIFFGFEMGEETALDMPTWLANKPMVTPAKPEVLKRFRPASRIRSRVARPVWFIAGYYSTTDHPSQCFDSYWEIRP